MGDAPDSWSKDAAFLSGVQGIDSGGGGHLRRDPGKERRIDLGGRMNMNETPAADHSATAPSLPPWAAGALGVSPDGCHQPEGLSMSGSKIGPAVAPHAHIRERALSASSGISVPLAGGRAGPAHPSTSGGVESRHAGLARMRAPTLRRSADKASRAKLCSRSSARPAHPYHGDRSMQGLVAMFLWCAAVIVAAFAWWLA